MGLIVGARRRSFRIRSGCHGRTCTRSYVPNPAHDARMHRMEQCFWEKFFGSPPLFLGQGIFLHRLGWRRAFSATILAYHYKIYSLFSSPFWPHLCSVRVWEELNGYGLATAVGLSLWGIIWTQKRVLRFYQIFFQ